MDERKLELCHARELVARFLNFGSVEAGDLDQDAVVANRTDDRLVTTKIVHTLTNDLDGLIQHRACDLLLSRNQTDQKGGAALDIETKLNFFLRRPDGRDTERNQQYHQRAGERSLTRPKVCGEIPPEKDQQTQAGEKCKHRAHRIFDFRSIRLRFASLRTSFSISDLVIASTLQPFN